MIVLRSPKGWTAPHEVEGHRLEGFWRAHQVPLPDVKKDPEQLRLLESWMRSQKPEELFDGHGKFVAEFRELAPVGNRRMSANLARQRRTHQARPSPARLPRVRRAVREARHHDRTKTPALSAFFCATS